MVLTEGGHVGRTGARNSGAQFLGWLWRGQIRHLTWLWRDCVIASELCRAGMARERRLLGKFSLRTKATALEIVTRELVQPFDCISRLAIPRAIFLMSEARYLKFPRNSRQIAAQHCSSKELYSPTMPICSGRLHAANRQPCQCNMYILHSHPSKLVPPIPT